MNEAAPRPRPDTGTIDVAFVLLAVQASIGIFAALTMLVIGAATGALPLMGSALLIAILWPAGALALAAATARLHRWARRGVLVYEGLALAAWAFSLLFSARDALHLMDLVTGAVLPLSIFVLMWMPSARMAVRRTPRRVNGDAAGVPKSLERAA